MFNAQASKSCSSREKGITSFKEVKKTVSCVSLFQVNDNAICEDCGQHFTQRGTLYLHMRKVHGKEPLVDKNKQNRGDQNEKVFIDPALVLQEYPELERDEQFRMNRNLLDPNDETGPSALPTFAF